MVLLNFVIEQIVRKIDKNQEEKIKWKLSKSRFLTISNLSIFRFGA